MCAFRQSNGRFTWSRVTWSRAIAWVGAALTLVLCDTRIAESADQHRLTDYLKNGWGTPVTRTPETERSNLAPSPPQPTNDSPELSVLQDRSDKRESSNGSSKSFGQSKLIELPSATSLRAVRLVRPKLKPLRVEDRVELNDHSTENSAVPVSIEEIPIVPRRGSETVLKVDELGKFATGTVSNERAQDPLTLADLLRADRAQQGTVNAADNAGSSLMSMSVEPSDVAQSAKSGHQGLEVKHVDDVDRWSTTLDDQTPTRARNGDLEETMRDEKHEPSHNKIYRRAARDNGFGLLKLDPMRF